MYVFGKLWLVLWMVDQWTEYKTIFSPSTYFTVQYYVILEFKETAWKEYIKK